MSMQLSDEHATLFYDIVTSLNNNSRILENKKYIQHGSTSVYIHCLSVAWVSCMIAEKLDLEINWTSLIKGAILHDYFLYDWHVKDTSHRLHGFSHARVSLDNAEKDLILNETEKDIILRHMFPLNITPPGKKESWIVCIADKVCSLFETFYKPIAYNELPPLQ